MRNLVIIIVCVLGLLSCFLAYNFNQQALTAENNLNAERYNRIVAEEALQKAQGEVRTLQSSLSKAEKNVEKLETLLEQTKAVNSDLKDRLDQAAVIKENLETKIQELMQLSAQ